MSNFKFVFGPAEIKKEGSCIKYDMGLESVEDSGKEPYTWLERQVPEKHAEEINSMIDKFLVLHGYNQE